MPQKEISEKTLEKYKLVIDEWFVNGNNGTKAYQKFYPKSKETTAKVNFSKILTFTNVQQYLNDKRKALIDQLEITSKRQLFELENIRVLATKSSKFSNAIEAIKEQNRLLGYYEADNLQKSSMLIETREERDAYIKLIEDKIKNGSDV